MKTSQILFTRQTHDADRAGLHYDIRLVAGGKAHSFATRKELPDPGKAIMLYETSVHTADYALRKRIVIPKGNYGAGTTTLDFVRKATLTKNHDKGHFVMETTKGERFLLKPLPVIAGKKTWLFKNLGKNETMEKEAAKTSKGNKYLQHLATGVDITNSFSKSRKKKATSKNLSLSKNKPQPVKSTKSKNKYLKKIASDLDIATKSKGEEDKAINDYTERLTEIKNPELKKATEHAREEEKDHSSKFGKAIQDLKNE